MKKTLIGLCCLCTVSLLTSCYSSTVCVGDMKKNEPAVKVNTVHNHHFLYGLIGSKTVKGKNYVDGRKDYKIKRCITFTDGLLQSITMGIYTPSTTQFYVPLNKATKKSKKSRNHDNDDD